MGGRGARIKRYAGMSMVVLALIRFGGLAFQNPDMTLTRLLLTYWPSYLAGLVIIAVGILLAGEAI